MTIKYTQAEIFFTDFRQIFVRVSINHLLPGADGKFQVVIFQVYAIILYSKCWRNTIKRIEIIPFVKILSALCKRENRYFYFEGGFYHENNYH